MITLLSKLFIKDRTNYSNGEVRSAYGTLCGAVGIFFNLLLFIGKFIAGSITGSIAIVADAFNNLSDAGSNIIALIGIRLASKKPDPEHPFGHGRMEYITGLIVSIAILLMGFELGKSSFEKILHPEAIEFSMLSVVLLIAAILVKFYMFIYNNLVAKKIDSVVLKATAKDSLSDMASTSVVLISTIVCAKTGLAIDGWCGILVAILILLAGYGALKDTIAPLLGQPPEQEFIDKIEALVMAHEEIYGVHDMIVHDYGPGRVMISLHAEVSSTADIMETHDVIDCIEAELFRETGAQTTIHMDPIVVNDEKVEATKQELTAILKKIDERISFHDFRMVDGPTHTNLIFDVLVPFNLKIDDVELRKQIRNEITAYNPSYFAVIQVDKNYLGQK